MEETVTPRDVQTFCRICEAFCGIRAQVNEAENRVEQILPDREHPVSQGYICVKGAGLGALNEDPDRLNFPQKRENGALKRISWQEAYSQIGAKTREIIKTYGPNAVAMYTGNPTFYNYKNALYSGDFLKALGSEQHYSSHSVDVNNKFHVSAEMYGLSIVHPIPDLKHTNFLMILGSNPAVSQMSVIQAPNIMKRLKQIETRGGKVLIIDPRKSETAAKLGEHIFIRPGTDVYLLAGIAHTLFHERKLAHEKLKPFIDNLKEFLGVWEEWTPERVASLTDIPAEKIREIATDYTRAEGATIYMSVGVNMGPFGSLAYWLVQALNLLSGNLDTRGGTLVPEAAFNIYKLAKMLGLGVARPYRSSGGFFHVAGCLPVGSLADEINREAPDRIRALFVSAGNPIHSVPGDELRKALPRLELLVSIDIYPNKTAAYADYLLPTTDILERDDFPISHMSLQETPYAQYTERILKPKFERREEWEIFSELAVASGAKVLGSGLCNFPAHWNHRVGKRAPALRIKPESILALLLRWGGKVSLKQLRKDPGGILLPENKPGSFLGKRVFTGNGRVNLAPPSLLADLPRMRTIAEKLEKPGPYGDELVLIGRRDRRTHNSWMLNNRHIKQPDSNVIIINPADAIARGINDNDLVRITGNKSEIQIPARVSEEVRPGVVCVPHGWGHAGTGLTRAAGLSGANINPLLPGGVEHMEPVSGQSIMTAHRVRVFNTRTSPRQQLTPRMKEPIV